MLKVSPRDLSAQTRRQETFLIFTTVNKSTCSYAEFNNGSVNWTNDQIL